MGNYVVCPRCKKVITDNPLVDSAATGEGQGTDFFICECGEKITFWAASAQLGAQQRLGNRIARWFRNLFRGRA